MATPPQIPVQSSFKIRTPSMTVSITTEDLLIPPLHGFIPVPGNLVSIASHTEASGNQLSVRKEAASKVEPLPDSPSFSATSTGAPSQHPMPEANGSEMSDILGTDRSVRELSSPALPVRRGSSAYLITLPRSSSKYADAVYGKFGAPPPIQTLDAEVSEQQTAEGVALTGDEKLESKDYTYWNKLRRKGTRTEIRRWHTYVPESERDTAFFGRSVGVDVPAEAYTHGTYYKQLEEELQVKEYKLPTLAYVAKPVWVRRVKGLPLCESAYQCSYPILFWEHGGTCRFTCEYKPHHCAERENVAV